MSIRHLTWLRMRADFVEIRQRRKKTILFAAHDVDEAVQLSKRIVVLGGRSATIQAHVPVLLPRQRELVPRGLNQRPRCSFQGARRQWLARDSEADHEKLLNSSEAAAKKFVPTCCPLVMYVRSPSTRGVLVT